ncbi:MAG TPA: SEC-C metal-binding domain-containing protein, partial [Chloroflexota bacterium]
VGSVLSDDELVLMLEDLAQSLPLPEDITAQSLAGLDPTELTRVLMERCVAEFEREPGQFHSVLMREFERQVVLGSVDTLWVEHLTGMDDLREGIGLRAFGQRDPLVEYKREAHETWERFVSAINAQIVQNIFRLGLRIELVPPSPQTQTELHTNLDEVEATPALSGQARRAVPAAGQASTGNGKIGRNDLCPCGSGKKYKFCHGATADGALQSGLLGAPKQTNGAISAGAATPPGNKTSTTPRRAKQARRRG